MSCRSVSGGFSSFLGIRRLPGALAKWLRRALTGRPRSGPMDQVQLALVIPVEGKFAQEVTRMQIEILRKYGRNPGLEAYPHITLKMGFSATDMAPFGNYVERLAGEVSSFEISVKNFDFFEDGILFLDVEPNPTLEQLRQRILFDLATDYGIKAEDVEGTQFRFHITLAYGLSQREFDELRESCASREIHFKFEARHLDLFCHTGAQWVSSHHAALLEGSSFS